MTGQLSDDGNFMWNEMNGFQLNNKQHQQHLWLRPSRWQQHQWQQQLQWSSPPTPTWEWLPLLQPSWSLHQADHQVADWIYRDSAPQIGLLFAKQYPNLILILIVNGLIFGCSRFRRRYNAHDRHYCVMFNILASHKSHLVMGMGIADGLGKSGLGYMGSWKTAFTAILESIPVLLTAAIMFGVGLGMLEDSAATGGLLIFLSGTILMLFQFGLMAFMARKVATDL